MFYLNGKVQLQQDGVFTKGGLLHKSVFVIRKQLESIGPEMIKLLKVILK
jgi:hypothetical protein